MPASIANAHTRFHRKKVGIRHVILYMLRDDDVDVSINGSEVTISRRGFLKGFFSWPRPDSAPVELKTQTGESSIWPLQAVGMAAKA